MSVQTTPSLKKLSEASPVAVANIPAQPTFTSPPKVEEKAPEVKEDKPKSDLSSITSIGDEKLDGKFLFIPSVGTEAV